MNAQSSREVYQAAFEAECRNVYPEVDAFEARAGFVLDRSRLEQAARVLACPVKVNPPCWQHGRVIYALTRKYVHTAEPVVRCLDIGSAKGFSALCLYWAVHDERGQTDAVTSVDVIDPLGRVRRNTVAECDGLKTLAETHAEFPDAANIRFCQMTGMDALRQSSDRIHVAFVDGKHDFAVVKREAELLRSRQAPGDVAVFDDLQIPGVHQAVCTLQGYAVEDINLANGRRYAVAVRT